MKLYVSIFDIDFADFNAISGLTDSLEVGSMSGDEVCVDISLSEDEILEGDQLFIGNIDSTSPLATISNFPPIVPITIQDKNLEG